MPSAARAILSLVGLQGLELNCWSRFGSARRRKPQGPRPPTSAAAFHIVGQEQLQTGFLRLSTGIAAPSAVPSFLGAHICCAHGSVAGFFEHSQELRVGLQRISSSSKIHTDSQRARGTALMGSDIEQGKGAATTVVDSPPAKRGCMPACSRALNFITAACTMLVIVAFGLAIALGPHERVGSAASCCCAAQPVADLALQSSHLQPAGVHQYVAAASLRWHRPRLWRYKRLWLEHSLRRRMCRASSSRASGCTGW